MTTRKKKSQPQPASYTTISNCTVQQTATQHNEHTRASIEALSNAATANADAIAENARTLALIAQAAFGPGSRSEFGAGINLSGGHS